MVQSLADCICDHQVDVMVQSLADCIECVIFVDISIPSLDLDGLGPSLASCINFHNMRLLDSKCNWFQLGVVPSVIKSSWLHKFA